MNFANNLNENTYIIKKHAFYIKVKNDVFVEIMNFEFQFLNQYFNNHFFDFYRSTNKYSIDYNYNIININTNF